MSNWDEETIIKTYSKFLGAKEEDFKPQLQNPLNKDILTALDHNDNWGQ